MNSSVFTFNEKNCTSCYSCVRKCPVKAIKVTKESIYPEVINERCIGCGSCIMACSFNAIIVSSSIETVKSLIKSNNKVAAICDPSIAGEFEDITDYRKFVKMIRKIGFDYVTEVAFGVDLVANRQAIITNDKSGKYYLTSHCPVMNLYVEKYATELVENITRTVSPASATAVALRNIYGDDLKIVNISPCLGAKKDINRHTNSAKIDAVLSFKELRKIFKELNIREEAVEYSDFDLPLGYKGSLYPIPEGFVEACGLSTSLVDGSFISAQGAVDAIDAVKQFSEYGNKFNKNFNLYFCEGCIVGPGSSDEGQKFIRHNLVTEYVKKRISNFDKKTWESNIRRFSNIPSIKCNYNIDSQSLPVPTEQEMEDAYEKLGKATSGRHTDCHACGYGTCKGLAEAIAQGIATEDMCFTHTQTGNRIFHDQLQSTTKELISTQEENSHLKDNINLQQIKNVEISKALSIMVHSLKIGVAIIDHNMKIADSNTSFIEILGDEAKEIDEIIPGLVGANINSLVPKSISSQIEFLLKSEEGLISKDIEFSGRLVSASIFSLIPNKNVCIMIRNLYDHEEKPQEIINRVTEVIQQNLRQVQEIGFILGEGASNTEKMLNTIIKLTKNEG
ncbi:MAG: [Fe-Fe] hydrogenase large subunit C-terminal domain-containing protein [Bacteroidales bacterium]